MPFEPVKLNIFKTVCLVNMESVGRIIYAVLTVSTNSGRLEPSAYSRRQLDITRPQVIMKIPNRLRYQRPPVLTTEP